MVRECRPPAREPGRSWPARRSTMATSTPANANSPANISPVGPPPAITTACSVIATLRPAAPRVPPSDRRPRATHLSSTAQTLHDSHFHRFWPQPAIMRHDPGLAASPPVRYRVKVEGKRVTPFSPSLWTDNLLAKGQRGSASGRRDEFHLVR